MDSTAAAAGQRLALDGVLVLDLSRMLPGAVVARQLLDLGARLVKVEDPGVGDPMRLLPPYVGGVGAGFAAFLRGAESVCLNLRDPADAARLERLAGAADVLVESFRPGTLDGWGLGRERLSAANPRLVWCSLSGFGQQASWSRQVGHDLNFTAASGGLRLMCAEGVASVQLADVGAALLATTSILAALLLRQRTGQGAIVDQPLAAGPLPFLTWPWAEASAGGDGSFETLLSGRCPCYRTYPCAGGEELAVAAVEPKFWVPLVEALGLPHLAGDLWDVGEVGQAAVAAVAGVFASQPRSHWLALARERNLPLTPVHRVGEPEAEAYFADLGCLESTPMPGGTSLVTPGPYLGPLGRTPSRPAPELGEHTAAVLAELT